MSTPIGFSLIFSKVCSLFALVAFVPSCCVSLVNRIISHYIDSLNNHNLGFLQNIPSSPLYITNLLRRFNFMDLINKKHYYISHTFVTHYIESYSSHNLGFLQNDPFSPLYITSLLRWFIFVVLISPKLCHILHLSFFLNNVSINSLAYVGIVIMWNNNSRNQILSSRFFSQNNDLVKKNMK